MSDASRPETSAKPFSEEIKNFYSAGATFSFVACAGTVDVVWGVFRRMSDGFVTHDWFCLVLSALVVFAYALVIPEPPGWKNARQLRITLAELIFGTMNAFVVCAVVIGLRGSLPA